MLLFIFFSVDVFSQAPVANFSAVDPDGCAPHTVIFNDNSTGGAAVSWLWDFGDQNAPGPSTQQNPSHIYQNAGHYTVTMTATNSDGSSTKTLTQYITVFKNPVAAYTVNDDTICSGQSITFTDASTLGDAPINSWSWTFNDGTPTVSGNPVTHTYINVSSQIKLYITNFTPTDANGCNSLGSSKTVYILPAPTASFSVNPSSCTFPASVSFTNQSSGPQLYSWNFNDPSSGPNNFSNAASPIHTYNSPGNYLVTLVNGVSGCSAQDTMTIFLQPPSASFTRDTLVCVHDTAHFINTSTAGSISFWTFGDGISNSTNSPNHIYNFPSLYNVTLISTLGNCSDTVTKTVRVPPLPISQFISTKPVSCSEPFTVSFQDTVNRHFAWSWNFGDPGSGSANTSSLSNPSHSFSLFSNSVRDSFDISLTVTDGNGCSNSLTLPYYVNIHIPEIQINEPPDSGCLGSTFSYFASVNSPNDTTIIDYSWDFGDGTPVQSGVTSNQTHTFNTIGIYDVTLIVTTASGCKDTLKLDEYAKVGTRPIAEIDSVLDTLCFQSSFTFHDLSHPQPITGWLWDFGDMQASTEQNPTHEYKYDTSGVADPFDIILYAYYNGCADTDTVFNMIAVISPVPLFDVVPNCINEDSLYLLNITTGGNTYTWDYGHSVTTTNDTNSIHVFPGRGTYDVTLTAVNASNGCVVDTVMPVHVYDITSAINTFSDSACEHPGVIFYSASQSQDADSLWWNFGDPGSPFNTFAQQSAAPDTLHDYSAIGYYNSTLITQDPNGCKDTSFRQIHIIGPSAGFTANPLTGCLPPGGFNVTFTDTSHSTGSAIDHYVWNFGTAGSNQTTTSTTISKLFTIPNTYTITEIVTDLFGCIDTATSVNYINPTRPTASITNPIATGCRNTPDSFVGNAGPAGTFLPPVTYLWDFGDGTIVSDTSHIQLHSFAANGIYHVTLLVTDANGCVDNTFMNRNVFTTSAHFTVDTTGICVNVNGIKRANVEATFHSDSTDHVTHANYDWNLTVFQDANSTYRDYTYNYNVPPGTYPASLTLTNDFGCVDTYTLPGAVVVPGPTGSFSFTPDSGCSPLTVNFTGIASNTNIYSWDFGDGSVISGTSSNLVTHTYNAIGAYTPQFLLGFQLQNDFCYIPVDTVGDVQVTSTLDVNIVETIITIPTDETATLTVNVTDPVGLSPYTYNWNPANLVSNGPTSNTFLASGDKDSTYYYVNVPYGSSGCAGIDSVLIIYPQCEFDWDSIPNVFTPDGDFKNDTYYINNLCISKGFWIKIYNRWGRLVYESSDPTFHWDGTTTSGAEASEGVYYYVLNARKRNYHGYIELIRNKN